MTTRVLWGSGTLCAILAVASLFACTPARPLQTVERIPASQIDANKSCPYSPKMKIGCVN